MIEYCIISVLATGVALLNLSFFGVMLLGGNSEESRHDHCDHPVRHIHTDMPGQVVQGEPVIPGSE